MSAQHTPGPWAWAPGREIGEANNLYGLGGQKVLAYESYEGMWFAVYDKETDVANARLIAAAPELLEALELVVGSLRFERIEDDLNREVLRRVEAAIAKVTT